MAPPVKMDKHVSAFLKKNREPDEELVAYVYADEWKFLRWVSLHKLFLLVTNRRVILTEAGLLVAEPTRVIKSVPCDQVKLEVARKGIIWTKLRIRFPGTPQIRLYVHRRFITARVVEALLPDDEPR